MLTGALVSLVGFLLIAVGVHTVAIVVVLGFIFVAIGAAISVRTAARWRRS